MPTPAAPSKTVPESSRFAVAIARVLRHEGGFNNIPADKGGATNFGISLRFAIAEARIDPVVRRALDLDMDGDIDVADIRALTRDRAAAVYRRCFWDRYRCGDLPAGLDAALFDQAVNGGGVAAVKMLQQAVNLAAMRVAVVVDGRMGPETTGQAHLAGATRTLKYFRDLARLRYLAIVRAEPSQAKFLDGWLARARALGDV